MTFSGNQNITTLLSDFSSNVSAACYCFDCGYSILAASYLDPMKAEIIVYYECKNKGCKNLHRTTIPLTNLQGILDKNAIANLLAATKPKWISVGKPKIINVCVCGGRTFNNKDVVFNSLDEILKIYKHLKIIHGDAKGADKLAGAWAWHRKITVEPFPAEWTRFGNGAGPIRNRKMLEHGIDILVAFPGGKGTADMKSICLGKGDIFIWEPCGQLSNKSHEAIDLFENTLDKDNI